MRKAMVERRCDSRFRLPRRRVVDGLPTMTPAGRLVPSAMVSSLGRSQCPINRGCLINRLTLSGSGDVAAIEGAQYRPIGAVRANRTAIAAPSSARNGAARRIPFMHIPPVKPPPQIGVSGPRGKPCQSPAVRAAWHFMPPGHLTVPGQIPQFPTERDPSATPYLKRSVTPAPCCVGRTSPGRGRMPVRPPVLARPVSA